MDIKHRAAGGFRMFWFLSKLSLGGQVHSSEMPNVSYPRPLATTSRDTTVTKIQMANIDIKRISINEIDKLQKIGKQTFSETFSSNNSEEDMKKYLDEGFSSEKLKAELTDKNSEFYFAILDNKIIGYLKVNFGQSQTEIKGENSLEIERIYVLTEFYGKKVGQ